MQYYAWTVVTGSTDWSLVIMRVASMLVKYYLSGLK